MRDKVFVCRGSRSEMALWKPRGVLSIKQMEALTSINKYMAVQVVNCIQSVHPFNKLSNFYESLIIITGFVIFPINAFFTIVFKAIF